MGETQDLLTIAAIRDILERDYGIPRSRQAVQRAARFGRIPVTKPGVEYLAKREDLPQIAEYFHSTGY